MKNKPALDICPVCGGFMIKSKSSSADDVWKIVEMVICPDCKWWKYTGKEWKKTIPRLPRPSYQKGFW